MKTVQIGSATLILGDCFEAYRAIPPGSVDAFITDPPYGITRNKWDVALDLPAFWSMADAVCKENAVKAVFSAMPFSAELVMSNRKKFRYEMIFKKPRGVRFLEANRMPISGHENIEIFYNRLPVYHPQKVKSDKPLSRRLRKNYRPASTNWGEVVRLGDWIDDGYRHPTSVIEVEWCADLFKKAWYDRHPTQKPVKIFEWLIKSYTDAGELVFDPFMGNGSSGVAAMKTGRRFIGIEQEERYFQTACARIERARHEVSLLELCQPRVSINIPDKGMEKAAL